MQKKPMLALAAALILIAAFAVYQATRSAALPKVAAMPRAGDPAPAFDLPDQDGTRHRLADYQGKTLLIAFYPADFTPGCSLEAHTMSAAYGKLTAAGLTPIGVSVQSESSHKAFCHSFSIPYPLLADTGKKMAADYGVLATGALGGVANRVTFIIAPDGKIAYVDPNVDGHLATCAADWIQEAHSLKTQPHRSP